jgi:hypothetical protein
MKIAPLLTAVVLAVPGLAACGGGENPKPAPLPTATQSTTTAPTPVGPPKGAGRKGAEAFATYYFAVVTHSIQTGDTRQLTRLSSPHCVSCKAIARNVERVYGAGGHTETAGWIVKVSRWMGRATIGDVAIRVQVHLSPETTFTSPTASPKQTDGAVREWIAYLERSASGWLVERLDLQAPPA